MVRGRLILTFLFSLFLLPVFGQSTTRADSAFADSVRAAARRMVDAHNRVRDSINFERVRRHVDQHGQSLDDYLAAERERERKEKRSHWVRLGAGAILLFALFVAIARRSKQRNRHT
jgi:hypothetical protein